MTDDAAVVALYEAICVAHAQTPSASPAWLATAAMQVIGFSRDLHSLAYRGAHETCEQIARAIAAGKDRDQIVHALTVGIDLEDAGDDLPVPNISAMQDRQDALVRHASYAKLMEIDGRVRRIEEIQTETLAELREIKAMLVGRLKP